MVTLVLVDGDRPTGPEALFSGVLTEEFQGADRSCHDLRQGRRVTRLPVAAEASLGLFPGHVFLELVGLPSGIGQDILYLPHLSSSAGMLCGTRLRSLATAGRQRWGLRNTGVRMH